MNTGKIESRTNGWVDTGSYTNEQNALLVFASQLKSDDLTLDVEAGNVEVLTALAMQCGLDVSEDGVLQLVEEAMGLLQHVEQSTGAEFEGW